MTFTRLTVIGIILYAVLLALKLWFFKDLNPDSRFISIAYGFLTFIIAVAAARRLGVLNFLEALFACGLWLAIFLLLDYIILNPGLGSAYFGRPLAWYGYGIMVFAIFFFHKKRHVQIRRELAAKHGQHH